MTFRERLAQEHPGRVDDKYNGGCLACPAHYGYEPDWDCLFRFPSLLGETQDQRCTRCWNREIPNNGGDKA